MTHSLIKTVPNSGHRKKNKCILDFFLCVCVKECLCVHEFLLKITMRHQAVHLAALKLENRLTMVFICYLTEAFGFL